MIEIAASILSADFTQLGTQLWEAFTAVAKAGVNYAVVGSALFNSHASVTENLRALREAASQSAPVYEPMETGRMPS